MDELIRRLVAAVLSLVALFGSFSVVVEPEPTYTVYRDVRYGDAATAVMDIYVPDLAPSRYDNGCVLMLHGGSWMTGDKSELAPYCEMLARHGYIAATMNYTLFTEENALTVSAETMLGDIDAAIDALAAFSNEYGLDITKLATSGYSAGAHLSMLYTYSRPEQSAIPIVFTASAAGPSDFSYAIWGALGSGAAAALAGADTVREYLLAGRVAEIPALVSPVTYICEDSVPSLFAYAGQDSTVPAGNDTSVLYACRMAGVRHEWILFPNSDHDLQGDPDCRERFLAAFLNFCQAYFGY